MLKRTRWWLVVPAFAAPVLGQPIEEGPEPGVIGWAKGALRCVQGAVVGADAGLRNQLGAWREQVRKAAIEEAKAVEPRRGMYVYVSGAEGRASGWLHKDDIATALPARVILLVHGLDEPGGIWSDLAPTLAAEGYTALRFDYRNDDSAAASARELADAMRALKRAGVSRVDIVAHSMGGLVARDVLTHPAAYAGAARGHDDLPDVHRMITLGTPNRGSVWANLAGVSDLREHMARWMSDPGEPRHLLGFLVDGDGHAGDDLLPGSEYLAELNGRGLPKGVVITAVIAHMFDVDEDDLRWLTEAGPVRRVLGKENAQQVAGAVRGASSWLGDGVVCIDSAQSECIEDVVEVPANHRTMIRNFDVVVGVKRAMGDTAAVPPAIPIILERLARQSD
jgi:pimeloyl-ACP methyl ester carboxylesterase